MISFNRGEWSEFYGVLFLLLKPNVNIVDCELKSINNELFTIKRIILDSSLKLEYFINDNGFVVVYADNEEIKKVSFTDVQKQKEELLNQIINNDKSSGAFTIASIDDFINEMTNGCSFKSKSNQKYDLITLSIDNLKKQDFKLSYSVKSSLGSPATILNSSKNTDFIYEVKNFPIECIDEVNKISGKTKLIDRIEKIKQYNNVSIEYIDMSSNVFKHNLEMVDSLLPIYIGRTLLYSYEYDNKKLKDIFELANPDLESSIASKKLGDFLSASSFGFVPGQKWDGLYSVNGGLIIVKNDGDVVILDLVYYRDEVIKYLINETKLDTPSTTRYHMLELFEKEGKVYFTLNLQVRYKK